MFHFLPLMNSSVTIGLNIKYIVLSISTNHISNLIIKYDQYFIFFNWILLFNIFMNIIRII